MVRAGRGGVDAAGHVSTSSELVLEVAPEPEHVRTARLFAAAAARQFNVDEERVEDLKVAISEACTNSFRAHTDAGVSDPVRVIAVAEVRGVRFSVVDVGRGFEPPAEETQDDAAHTPPAGIFEGSLGLTLIRALFPDVHIARNPGRGMTVSFVVEAAGSEEA
jgi:serine/threonine-protein kinase RsbW